MTKLKNKAMRREHISILIIILAVLLVTLPFINKAFNIDDIYVMAFADHLAENPFDPYGFQLDFITGKTTALSYTDTPLIPLYASFLLKYFGQKEALIHLGFLIFPLLAGISMFYFSRQFTRFPIYAALLMIATPTFVVHSHLVMQDIPILTLTLLAIAFHIYGVNNNNSKYLAVAAFIAGMAFLVKYSVIILLLLMVVYSLMHYKFKALRYMGITLLMILLFFAHNLYFYGTIHLFHSLFPWLMGGKGISAGLIPLLRTLAVLFISSLNYLGGAVFFFPFLIWPFIKQKKKLIGLIIISAVSLILSIILYAASKNFVSGQYTFVQLLLFFTFVTSGIFIIYAYLADNYRLIKKLFKSIISVKIQALNKKEKNVMFLVIWFVVVFVFNFTLAGGSVRYNVLLLPPFVLLFMSLLDTTLIKSKLHLAFGTIFVTTLILSLGIAFADYQYAETYRQIPGYFEEYTDNQVFFLGHSGFKYYMELNGAIFLTSYEGKVKQGDIIVKAPLANPYKLDQSISENIALNNIIEFNTKFPLRTLNSEAHAGWYNYGAGFLPFSISNAPLEKFEIYTVQKDFEK